MKFSIPVNELQGIVNLLIITAKVNTVEAQGRILVEVEDDSVLFLSNNFSTGISIRTKNAIITEPGKVSIEFSRLKSFVTPFNSWDEDKKEGAKDFVFKGDERNVIVSVKNTFASGKVSNGRMKLKVYNAAGINKFSDFEIPTFTLNSDAMKTAISKVLYAIDVNCMSAPLRGMCLKFTKDKIHFAGTDGRALSEFVIDNTCDLDDRVVVIKLDFVMGLRRLLMPDAELEFEVTDKDIKMRIGDIIFWGKIIIGNEYPEYGSIFEDYEEEVVVPKNVLLSNIMPFMDALDQKDYFRISIKIENKKLTFFNDDGTFICDCDFEFSNELTIDLDGNLLLKTLDAIKAEDISMRFSKEPSKNVFFDSALYHDQKSLIVPLRSRS
jgi:DNA polymerase III sliding clamp (beta) subunit (PCNA family)